MRKKRPYSNKAGLANELSEINDAAAAAFAQAAGFHFDESSITDSLDSNELQKGISQMSDYKNGSLYDKGRRDSMNTNSRIITGVMIQQAELAKTVESMESRLSRSSHISGELSPKTTKKRKSLN